MSRILLVEDNQADAILLQEALRQANVTFPVDVVTDGQKALDYLHTVDRLPTLILLDLNLPRMDGREVLSAVKTDPVTREIPVIILTTSSAPPDIELAYDRGANAYVRKPLGIDRLTDAVSAIRDFWLRTATLPSDGA
jgi:CheY-like chemotaxis protein